MAKVSFNEDKCKGCSLCVAVCPKKVIELSKDRINSKGYHLAEAVRPSDCIGCAFCAYMCPDMVITVEK